MRISVGIPRFAERCRIALRDRRVGAPITAAVLAMLGCLACPVPVSAQSSRDPAPASAFKDKTLTLIINYDAGGNVDTEARIFQRHLSRHIAGKPVIVAQNVPGSGGLTALNQMGLGIGIRDPSATFGFMTFNPIAPLIDDPALKVKVGIFPLIAGVGQWYVAYARRDALPGDHLPADIAKARNIYAAGYSRSSNHDIRLRLMFDLLGSGYKVVTGFQSVGAINRAIAQGEINFMVSTLPGYETQAVPNLIATGIAIPLWQSGVLGPNGELVGNPDLTRRGIGFFEDVYTQAHGRPPSGVGYAALRLGNDSSTKLARVVMMPPNAAPEAVAELRKAFGELDHDPEFVEDYTRIISIKPILFDAGATERALQSATQGVDPAVKDKFKQLASEP